MARMMFVNFPVQDLEKSKEFYSAIGFTVNPQFTDDTAACMVWSDHIYVMLLTHPKFRSFSPHEICDARQRTEVLVALNCENREEVTAMVNKALAGGGRRYSEPKDHGFMYQDGFQDPDGHVWEVFHMDLSAAPGA